MYIMSSGAYVCGGDGNGDGRTRGLGPPGFLTKIFNIVSDPNTNSVVSWSVSGNSFVIWDHLLFSGEVIPKHFKHNNFSSFVYQLNNYGFRKIGVEHRWEYEHPYFRAGNECLLTNIKRRNQNPNYVARKRRSQTQPYDGRGPSEELILRNGIQESILEIQNLKKQQKEMDFRITATESDLKDIKKKNERLIMCWAKACDLILARKIRHDTGEDHNIDDDGKRRKLEKNAILIEDDEKIDGIKDCDGENDEIQVIEDDGKDKKDYDGGSNPDPKDAIPLPEIETASSESGTIQVNQDKESGYYTCSWMRTLLEDENFAETMREKTKGNYPGLKDYQGENNPDHQDRTRVNDNAKTEANPVSEEIQSGYSNPGPIKEIEDCVYWTNMLMGDSDEDCDNESRAEMENRASEFALDLKVVMAKLADDHHET